MPEGTNGNGKQAKEIRPTWWKIPLITAAALAALFTIAYLAYVPARREYLANRNFRALAVLGDQVQQMVSIHGSILEFAADLSEPDREQRRRRKEDLKEFLVMQPGDRVLQEPERSIETRKDYLAYLAPHFELVEVAAGKEQASEAASRLNAKRRNGSWELVMEAERHPRSKRTYSGRLNLDSVLKPLTESLPFDDLMLVSEKGMIVYQRDRTGPQFITLASLLQAQTTEAKTPAAQNPGGEGGKDGESSSTVSQNSDPGWKNRSLHLTEVTLAGTRYKLFLQPLLLDVYSDEPHGSDTAQEWVLCGLKSAHALEWEALSISSTKVIWITAAFLILCMCGPVLKILLMNHRERLRFVNIGVLAVSFLLLTNVVTLTGLHAVGFPLNDDTEPQLQRLGRKLSRNIHDELRDMRDQMISWCRSPELDQDLRAAENREVIRKSDAGDDKSIAVTPRATIYPNLSNVFWTDDDGQQVVKWSASGFLTPLIDVSRQDLFRHQKTVFLDGKGPPFFFGFVVPPNKLEYLSVLTMKTSDCRGDRPSKGITDDIAAGGVGLSGQALSLMDPILPFGYGFALLDESGRVIFHADKTRNLHENFFQESDWNRQIYAAAFGHSATGSSPLKYMGRDYRALVTSIDGLSQAPWSLVVFRDLTSIRALNLEATTMATTILLLILFLPVLIAGIWCYMKRMRFAPEWLWPNRARFATYVSLVFIYSVLVLVMLAAGFTGTTEENLLACVLVPYAAIMLTVWCYMAHPVPSKRRAIRTGERSRWGIVVAPALLALVALATMLLASQFPLHAFPGWTVLLGFAFVGSMPAIERPSRYLLLRKSRTARNSVASDPQKATWRKWYLLSVLLPLVLLGVLTPLAVFRACLNVERRLEVKQSQLHLARALNQRLLEVDAACESGQMGKRPCEALQASAPAWKKIVLDGMLPDDGRLPTQAHAESAGGSEYYRDWFQKLISMLHHDFNNDSAEMSGLIPDRNVGGDAKEPEWHWEDAPAKGGDATTLRWHGVHFPGEGSSTLEHDLLITSVQPGFTVSDIARGVSVALLVIFVIGLLLWTVVRKLFLFQIAPLRIRGERAAVEAIREGRNVVLLLPMVGKWQLDEPKYSIDTRTLMTRQDWATDMNLAAIPSHTLIELDHFEWTSGDEEIDAQKMVLLDRLSRRENTQLIIVMTVAVSAEDYRRTFPQFEVIDLRDEPFYWLQQYEGPSNDLACRNLIWKECGPLPALWPLGAQLAADLRGAEECSPEAVASEMLERADSYYRLIWAECTHDQKFVLAQFAEDGFLNPTNLRPIRQLVRRGLITTSPQFRLVNESFRRFLHSVATVEMKKEWLKESRRTGWGKMHGAFFTTMVLLGVFLLTTQNALWQSSAAYVTTLLGALGTASKLFTTFRTGTVAEKAD